MMSRPSSHGDSNRHSLSMNLRLKLVLGMTNPNGSCITIHPESGTCAYAASNTIVLFDTINKRQMHYLKQSKKPLDTISFSLDGKLIVTGESGYMPPVCVWDVAQRACIGYLYGHDFGIKCVAFSPKGNMIVSIGNVFDGHIFVWSWPQKEKISSNRFSEEIMDMSFCLNENVFVTCGVHHIKFWYPQPAKNDRTCKSIRQGDDGVLYGRPAVLGDLKFNTFIGVDFGSRSSTHFTYVITSKGCIGLLSTGMRDVIKSNSVEKARFSCISVYDRLLITGTRHGNVYFWNALSLELINTLSLPSERGCAQGVEPSFILDESTFSNYVCYDHVHNIITIFSSDGRLSVWNIKDLKNLVKKLYCYNHCGGITSSDVLHAEQERGKKRAIYVTASSDGTLHLWGLDVTKRVSCDGVSIIFTDMKSTLSQTQSNSLESRGDDEGSTLSSNDDSCQGDLLTATKVCADYLVTGDNHGNVHAYSMSNLGMIARTRYHTRGVTCLEFYTSKRLKRKFLFSGGRDRLIVIYDISNNLKVVNTLQVQSGSITVLKTLTTEKQLLLVSSGLDRSLVISSSSYNDIPSFTVCYNRYMSSSAVDCVFNDQEFSVGLGTLSGDIYIFCLSTLNLLRTFQASCDPNARVEKLAYDRKSNVLLAACSDRSICAFNYGDGTLLASTTSHASYASGLHFSVNNHCIISSSTDGCIFVWGLSQNETKKEERFTTSRKRLRPVNIRSNISNDRLEGPS